MDENDIAGVESIDIVIDGKLGMVIKALKTFPPIKDKTNEIFTYCQMIGIHHIIGINFNHGSNATKSVSYVQLP